MNNHLPVLASVLMLSLSAAHAGTTTIDFSGTQYADNFTETVNGGNLNIDNDTLRFNNANSLAGIATYNTVFPSATNTDSFSLKIDGKFTTLGSLAGDSVGFMTNINGTSGYLAVFRLTSTGADFRLFEGATTTGSSVGTTLDTKTATATFANDTFYTFSLSVSTVPGTSISFTGSILNATTGSVIATFTTVTDNSPTFGGTANQVGLRLGTTGNINNYTTVDNFVLTSAAIPEPSTYALFGGLGVIGLAAIRRPRR